jgi:hypothetical protein
VATRQAAGEHPGSGKQLPQEPRRVNQNNPFSLKFAGNSANQCIRASSRKPCQHSCHAQVRQRIQFEDLHVLDLTGHHHVSHLFALQKLDQPSEMTNADPLHSRREVRNCRISLFPDSCNRKADSFGLCTLEYKKRKPAIAGDEPVLHSLPAPT